MVTHRNCASELERTRLVDSKHTRGSSSTGAWWSATSTLQSTHRCPSCSKNCTGSNASLSLGSQVPSPVDRLLRENGIHPVLVEIGPRDQPAEIWNGISGSSVYVAAGPDAELLPSSLGGQFYQAHVVDEVVIDRPEERAMLQVT